MGRQIVKGRDIAKIHSSELDGAYAHHHQGMTERNSPDEGEENGKRAAMRAIATKLAGRPDRQFPRSPNDNAQMKDVISNADMRAEHTEKGKSSQCPYCREYATFIKKAMARLSFPLSRN